jgi:hypothetical protein
MSEKIAVVTLPPRFAFTGVTMLVADPKDSVETTWPSLIHAASTIQPTLPVFAEPANFRYRLVPVQYAGVAIVALTY